MSYAEIIFILIDPLSGNRNGKYRRSPDGEKNFGDYPDRAGSSVYNILYDSRILLSCNTPPNSCTNAREKNVTARRALRSVATLCDDAHRGWRTSSARCARYTLGLPKYGHYNWPADTHDLYGGSDARARVPTPIRENILDYNKYNRRSLSRVVVQISPCLFETSRETA